MKIKLTLLFLLLIWSWKSIAQSNLPVAYNIVSETSANYVLPDSNWRMLEDTSGKLTIDQVSSLPLIAQFYRNNQARKSIANYIQSYWFCFQLVNSTSTNREICFNGTGKAQYELYDHSTDDYKWSHQLTGDFVPWSERDGFKRIQNVTLLIHPGQTVIVFIRVKFSYSWWYVARPFVLSFSFISKIARDKLNHDSTIFFPIIRTSFLGGLMLFGCLLSFLFFTIVGERVYLYFALMMFTLGFGRCYDILYDIFFKEHPVILHYLAYLLGAFADYFFIQFTRQFLKTRKYFPRWDGYFNGIAIFNVILQLLIYFSLPHLNATLNKAAESTGDLVDAFTLFSVLITYLFFNPCSEIRVKILTVFAMPALLVWSFGNLLNSLYFIEIRYDLPNSSFLNWFSEWFYFIELISIFILEILFSWVLLLRFVDLRKEIAQKSLEIEIERRKLIEEQKTQLERTVEERTVELKHSLENLQSSQKQLIQSEKMASLGELTAGIAHEIQNPLNFVNNFSEVNKELIEELKEEAKTGNNNEVIAIANDISSNEEKIIHHGKRADAIVKNMLQHSQSRTGVKELTNINALADQYLRLSYHGLRAKDTEFNAIMKTDFDESIGKINIVPQDIGRVLLNLYNNSFYAIAEKRKQYPENYEPTISVSSKKIGDRVMLTVKDNGNGIPKKVLDKIFQPFFTTKPTGVGTGLGLSLSYDIVKAHGGEIKVNTVEGEFTEFVVDLPNIN